MITLYLWNADGIYVDSIETDEAGAMPPRSTPTKPPKLTGSHCAKWTGQGWEKLSSAPTPDPAPGPTPAELTKLFESAIQRTLDTAANAEGFDSISTAISYAEEPAVPKFQNAGRRFRAWRSLVWAYSYEQLALVLSSGREQPTVEAFLTELPVLELPS